jgi:hypothetical protein
MTNNNRFDAALRAHVFHRPFLDGEESAAQPVESLPEQAAAESRLPDFASELEASLMRDLNKLTAGLRPKQLLPDRTSTPAPTVAAPPPAAEAKPQSRYAPPSQAARTTGPQATDSAPTVSPYAPPPRLPQATWPAATTSVPAGEPKQAEEKPPSPYVPQAKRPAPAPVPASPQTPPPPAAGRAKAADPPSAAMKPVSCYAPPPAPVPASPPTPLPVASRPAKPAAPPPPPAPAKTVSRYAPPKRPAYPGEIPRETAIGAEPIALSPLERPVVTQASAVASEAPALPDDEAETVQAIIHLEAAEREISEPAVTEAAERAEAESKSFAGPSATELAKLYAPQATATAPIAPEVKPESRAASKTVSPYAPQRLRKRVTAAPESIDASPSKQVPRPARPAVAGAQSGDSSRLRPIRWQARDEAPPGSLGVQRAGSWTSKTVIAIVLVGLIGGASAIVTLESLTAPVPAPSAVAADRTPPDAAAETNAAAAQNQPISLTVAARAPTGVEVVHAEDAGNGLAPADVPPLPSSAKVIPLPQPVTAGAGLRPTRGADPGGKTGNLDTTDAGDADHALPADAAPGAAETASDRPATDAFDVIARSGDVPAGPAPRSPTPRPEHDGPSADGVLAYAPTADPMDRGAKAFASKGDDKAAAKAPKSGSARVVSWVNMRVSADNNAATVKVLPAGSVVTVVRCNYWCEIVADGKRGFVYKNFLKATGETVSSQ